MPRRKCRCSECASLEHTAARCPILHPNGPEHDGRMWDAARWLAEQTGNICYADAGDRFEITREAVRMAWKVLDLGETPRERYYAARRKQIIELARAGKSTAEIAEAVGLSRARAYLELKQAGVEPGPSPHRADPAAIAAGIEVVRAGGTVGEGASRAGLQYSRFHTHMLKAGVRGRRLDADKLARTIGRGAQGALLVKTEGMTAGQAAIVVGCSPTSIRLYLERHEEESSDGDA